MVVYKVLEHYKGTNSNVLKMIKMWEKLTYDEKIEFFTELDEWNHYGF